MARMIGDSPDVHFCDRICWRQWGHVSNTKFKKKYKRHLKRSEQSKVRRELKDYYKRTTK